MATRRSIVETFYAFFEKGFVYKGLKPVFWCIHDQTALAEAEVEYEMHTSPSVYVRYRLTSPPEEIDPALAGKHVYTIIWTTTPWTIPASLAVAFNPEMEYVALDTPDGVYLVAGALRAEVEKQTGLLAAAEPLIRFNGVRLDGTTFQHPFLDRSVLGVTAPYVTADQGTGAVHTAPAHGVDDFYTGKRYNLPELQYVDNAGRQKNTSDVASGGIAQPYEGLTVFESNKVITDVLREHGALLSASIFEHSYPHCWRCHNPVIVRATEQWFISMETPMPSAATDRAEERALEQKVEALVAAQGMAVDQMDAFTPMLDPLAMDSESYVTERPEVENPGLKSETRAAGSATSTFRQRALDEIKGVTWDPAWGEERISNMIATRPDWCISRQRIWGVPIAVFLCNKCHEPLNEPEINASIVELFRKESADAWYVRTPAELLPAGTACANCGKRMPASFARRWTFSTCGSSPVRAGMRCWMRSRTLEFPADLYTEGGDQHRGWFHSSLLTSWRCVAWRRTGRWRRRAGRWTSRAARFRSRWAMASIRWMWRSGWAAEIIRLWVASVDFREDVAASENLMQRVSDNYRKLRNTLRFLLGNLHDFVPASDAVALARDAAAGSVHPGADGGAGCEDSQGV